MRRNAIFIITFTFSSILLSTMISCSKVKEKAKETIHKSGELVGESSSEFIEGVSDGVKNSIRCSLVLDPELIENGLQTGKYSVENDSSGGKDNVLSVYFIFNQDFAGEISAIAQDKNGLEIGRSKIKVEAKAGDAGYYDIKFDARTTIGFESRIEFKAI